MHPNDCPKCGIWHLGMRIYKKWLREYGASKSDYIKRQVARWEAIVAKHEGAPNLAGDAGTPGQNLAASTES